MMARQLYVRGDQGDPEWGETIVRLSRRATEIDPNYANAWACLGLGHVARRWSVGPTGDTGLSAAERALALNPKLSEGYLVRARVRIEEGRHEDAIRDVGTALRLEPESGLVNYTAGLAYYYADRQKEAIPFFEQAAALDRTDSNAPAFLVTLYGTLGNRTDELRAARLTLEHAEAVLEHNQSNAQALATKCRMLAKLGDLDIAQEWIHRALLIQPNNVAVRYNIAWALADSFSDAAGAIDMIEPALAHMSPGWLDIVKRTPAFQALSSQPRFQKLLAAAMARTK